MPQRALRGKGPGGVGPAPRLPVLPGTGFSLVRFAPYSLLALVLATAILPSARATVSGSARAGSAIADTLWVVDDLGRTVRLAEPARRIVSLVPALTETLYAIGAGDRLVGRTRYDRHPPAVGAVPSVGGGIRPSAEAILSLAPDLVILYAGPDNHGVVEELERVGLRTVAVRHNSVSDLERNLARLGRVTGCESDARRLRSALEAVLERIGSVTRKAPHPTVYYDIWWDPPITVGAGSYLDSLLELAGARNVFGERSEASPQVGLEAIAARDPDLILWPVERGSVGSPTPPSERPGWRVLRAVRTGAVRRVDGGLLHRLGPRLGEAALELAVAVHPELRSRLEAIDGRVQAATLSPHPCRTDG